MTKLILTSIIISLLTSYVQSGAGHVFNYLKKGDDWKGVCATGKK